MPASEYCRSETAVISKDASIPDAARLMRNHHVGEVIVVEQMDGKSVPVGILTDRDLVLEIIAMDINMEKITVGNVMSLDLVTVAENESLSTMLETMKQHGIRRLPVVDDNGMLTGLVNYEDILQALMEQMTSLVNLIDSERRIEQMLRP